MALALFALVLLIGATVGFLGGMFGKGGSAIATPLLVVAGIPVMAALASPLPATIPASAVAAWAYARVGITDWRLVRWTIAIGVPATVVGAAASQWVRGDELLTVTEVLLVVLGVRIAHHRATPTQDARATSPPSRCRMTLVAVGVGVTSGLLANSGGFMLAPMFIVLLYRDVKTAFAASLLVSTALAIPGTIVHAVLGHIDWTLVLLFGAASVPMARVGARTALRFEAQRLERVYGAGLALLGVTVLVVSR